MLMEGAAGGLAEAGACVDVVSVGSVLGAVATGADCVGVGLADGATVSCVSADVEGAAPAGASVDVERAASDAWPEEPGEGGVEAA